MNDWKPLTIFVKRSILDAWQVSDYASASFLYSPKKIFESWRKQEDWY